MNSEERNVWGSEDVSSGKDAGDENFPVGSLLISRRLRPHVHAYYDFARVIDDIVDTDRLDADAKITRLNAMEDVVLGKRMAPQRPDAQTAVRVGRTLTQTGVSTDTATDLIVAFRQDAVKNRYDTWEELEEYCRYSANPVGRFLLQLHGEDAGTFGPSDALCTALQIINHLQDCADDLRNLDRCYLPRPWLEREGVSVDDLRRGHTLPGMRRVFNALLDRVDELNRHAALLPGLIRDRRMRMEAAVIVGLSRRLAQRLRVEDPIARRVKLSRMDVARALAGAMRTLV
ncbi:squalene synthase HpnC [Komagataeibacter oboediens]|uniref:Squalene synthase HpnC n=1 Tax=Komagataeibacter oboediens TaxID=65958 RepID=A0A318R920_9PROT|nr:squalene synthase HpnC [Komagataeibacter oboediens]GBR29661.1 phytoene synthase [Komagataeibacter oboediens DSM 11826]MBL7234562.1 squalene synthase HpnC [Komagataeibacter oboediens]MBT0674460.1 squalene synthase HpnC [Komagataeibacter oboediens]MBT0678111.1 squalene synthase HpnC [Komagataeibacter oboediens]MBV1822727.1 squalene synthase HpnC [Komagataeibacter oboediens]